MTQYIITIQKSTHHKKWSLLKRGETLTLVEKVGDGHLGARVGLWLNGKKIAYCSGGGYDMRGTNIGSYLSTLPNAQKIMKKAYVAKCYGVHYSESKKRYYVDGACGLSSMEAVFGVSVRSFKA